MFGATDTYLQAFPPIQLPFVVRIEDEVDPVYYHGDVQDEDSLLEWIRQRTLPLFPEVCVVCRGNRPSTVARRSATLFRAESRPSCWW